MGGKNGKPKDNNNSNSKDKNNSKSNVAKVSNKPQNARVCISQLQTTKETYYLLLNYDLNTKS